MSYTIRPVTQLALVAVKRVSINGVNSLLLDEIGKLRILAPTNIIIINPIRIILALLNCFKTFFFISLIFTYIKIPHIK